MSKKIDEFTFTIKHSELSKYKADGITLDNVPEDFIEKYDEATIERAKELKAKHQSKYTDEYYLQMAHNLNYRDVLGAILEIEKKTSQCICEIKDPEWSNFSYEEIIQMENDGVKIPDEILEWAHAQQQIDITDYVLITENTEAGGNNSELPSASTNDLNSLRQRTIQDIAKIDKAEKDTQVALDAYKDKAETAKKIQSEKEDSYEDSMQEIADLTKEWKTLNDKQQNGTTLTKNEKDRLNELSKLLNGSNGKLMKEVQADNKELSDFLENLDSLSNKLDKNLEISQTAILNSRELSQIAPEGYGFPTPKQFAKDYMLGSNEITGAPSSLLALIASDRSSDLQVLTNGIIGDIKSDSSIKLAHFASDYTELATKTENNTKSTMGDAFDEAAPEDSDKQEKQEDKYQVDMSFTYKNAKKAAKTSGKATLDVLGHQLKTVLSNKKVKKDNQKTLKDIVKLNKETKKAKEKHKDYLSEEEKFLEELETIQGASSESSAGTSTEKQVKEVTENSGKNKAAKAVEDKADEKTAEAKEKDDKKQEIISKIKNVDTKDKKVKETVKKALTKSIASNAKSEKSTKDLNTKTNDLQQINDNSLKVAERTLIVGAGTFAKSFITTAVGEYLHATGIGLMPNPTTHTQGVIMNLAGQKLIKQGKKENKNGIMAMVAGGVGLAASAAANESKDAAKDRSKESEAMIKSNKKLFKDTQKALGIKNEVNTNNSSENNEQNMQGEEQAPQAQSSEQTAAQNPELGQAQAATSQSKTGTEAIPTTEDNIETTPTATTPETETEEEQTPENKSENSEETDTTNTTKTTDKKEDSGKTGDKEENQEQNSDNNGSKDDGYSVSLGFSEKNSLKATATTLAATIDLATNQSKVEKVNSIVEKETQASTKLTKETEKETNRATNEHNENASEADSLAKQLKTVQDTAENTEDIEEATNAQEQSVNLNTLLEKVKQKDAKVSQIADKTIKNGVNQIKKFQNNVKDLGAGIKDFNKKISNQLEVSEKTLFVGVGTGMLGALHIDQGTMMVATGTPMLSNPFTEAEGLALIANGNKNINSGIKEVISGGLAAVAGTAGIVVNSGAETVSATASIIEKTAQLQYRASDKVLKDSQKILKEFGIDKDSGNSNSKSSEKIEELQGQPNSDDTQDEENTVVNETTLAASASTNASISATTETDDKADRKLSRFNTESIIESRKKKKKVIAVSASSRNG